MRHNRRPRARREVMSVSPDPPIVSSSRRLPARPLHAGLTEARFSSSLVRIGRRPRGEAKRRRVRPSVRPLPFFNISSVRRTCFRSIHVIHGHLHCVANAVTAKGQTRGPIYKISYDNLTIDYLAIMPKLRLRSTYDGRLIYKSSYEGRKAFLAYDSLAKL